jgi:DNA-binding transcriptional ArsR family regulator
MVVVNSAGVASSFKKSPSLELDDMIEVAREASYFLKAMSHETRLLILCFLAEGEQSVSKLEEQLSLKQSNVSQHLGRLRLDGLVKTRRDGQTIYYSIANNDVLQVLGTLYEIFCKRRLEQMMVAAEEA